MKLPHAAKAEVPSRKITDYLLSPTHRAGKSKAVFFGEFGFSALRWEELAEALRAHATVNNVVVQEDTAFGVRYIVDGRMAAPDGTGLNIRSVWFVEKGGERPRFVTAHPLRRI